MSKNTYYYFWAVSIILFFSACHIFVLYSNNLNLFFDEAQYWNWAKNLDFGYYSKPPFIAWAIAATTSLCSDTEPCIRIASPIAHMLTAFAILLIGKKLFSPKIAMWSAITYISLPGVSFSSLLISTDPFLLMFWAWALFFLILALETNYWKYWLLLGVACGLGMLSKYAMCLFIPCFLFFLCWEKKLFQNFKNIKLWFALIISFLLYMPNLYWNYINSFVSYLHTKDNANLSANLFHPLQMLEFIASQFAVFGPILFAALLILLFKFKKLNYNLHLLLSFSIPVLAIMTIEAFLSRANANWAATAYISSSIAVVAWLIINKKVSWLKLSFCINSLIAIILYSNALLLFNNHNLDFMKRAKGWDTVGILISDILKLKPETLLISDERKILTPLLYYVRPFPQVIYKWNPAKKIKDHYDLTTNLELQKGKNFLMVSRFSTPQDFNCCFEKISVLKPIVVNIYPDYKINLNLFLLENFKGYPK